MRYMPSNISASLLLAALLSIFFFISPAISRNEPGELVKTRLEVPEKYKKGALRVERTLNVPYGFKVSVFAAGIEGARFMALDGDGNIYVSLTSGGKVVTLPDADKDGVADKAVTFARGLDRPHGLAFKGKDLIVAGAGSLVLLRDENGDLEADVKRVLTDDVPGGGGHFTRSIVIGPEGDFFISAGSSCNACVEKDRRRAAVLRFRDGKARIYATGLRNSVGIALHTDTKELWAADNGTDGLGDDIPPEELNRIVEGGDYGWPYCYGRKTADPNFGSPGRCKDTIPAVVEMQAHSAPLGIAFGFGLEFPHEFRDVLYIAFHGSWNRSVPTGYKLIAIPFRDGKPSGKPFDVITGWQTETGAWGRPVAPLVGKDGALYLSDDHEGIIYRVTAGEGK
ncbi:MAG: PQQ-dependent sugar dehydrogenase [Deltaproteobacteria bacterium]|nr:PQQ-dependent sugar dehydrogenase [Deltaproteobacteria bacterium]